MRRRVDYQWNLAEMVADRRLHPTSDLRELLAERGVTLSASQSYRLVTQRPERVSLTILAALCDIFECSLSDLITVTAIDVGGRASAKANSTGPTVELNEQRRPRRARILPPDG